MLNLLASGFVLLTLAPVLVLFVQVMLAVVLPGVAVTAEITGGVVSAGTKLAGALAITGKVLELADASAEVTR